MLNLRVDSHQVRHEKLHPYLLVSRGSEGRIHFHIHDGNCGHKVMFALIGNCGKLMCLPCVKESLNELNYEETCLQFDTEGRIKTAN